MKEVVNRFSLSLDTRLWNKSISVKKNDTLTRVLHVTLVKDGEVYSLENILVAAIKCIKPDNTLVYNDCAIVGNEIQYVISNQTIAAEGTVTCEMVLSDDQGQILTTPQFYIEVYDDLFGSEALESANEYKGIEKIAADCESAKNQCNAAVKRTEYTAEQITENMERSAELATQVSEAAQSIETQVSEVMQYAIHAEDVGMQAQTSATQAQESAASAAKTAQSVAESVMATTLSEANAKASAEKAESTVEGIENYIEESSEYAAQSDKSAQEARQSALLSQSYANGSSGAREGEQDDNAKRYCNLAKTYTEQATQAYEGSVQAGKEAVEQLKNAVSENVATFAVNMETGHLEYTGGTLTFGCDDKGHLKWEVTV